MIVILIIGILLAIAVPNYVTAREKARVNTCLENLRQYDLAKQAWAIDTNAVDTSVPVYADLCPTYSRGLALTCPSGGTYTINSIAVKPTCSIGGNHVRP